jgi:hypothetical protein
MHYQQSTHIAIVLPHWFDDSVVLGRALDSTPYSWPDPPLLRLHPPADEDAALQMKNIARTRAVPENRKSLLAAVVSDGAAQDGAANPSSRAPGGSNAWNGRKLLLDPSLGLSPATRKAIEVGIERAGGTVLRYGQDSGEPAAEEAALLIDEADVLVTRCRSGWAYVKVIIVHVP